MHSTMTINSFYHSHDSSLTEEDVKTNSEMKLSAWLVVLFNLWKLCMRLLSLLIQNMNNFRIFSAECSM